MVTRAKRQSNNAWDRENMKLLACKVRKDLAERFSAEAAARNTTPNAILKSAVLDFLGEKVADNEALIEIYLDDRVTLEQIQQAANNAGLTVNEWIIEAIKDKL